MLKKDPQYFAHAVQKLYSLKQVKRFILPGNYFLRESPARIANFLKPLDFKLFFLNSTP